MKTQSIISSFKKNKSGNAFSEFLNKFYSKIMNFKKEVYKNRAAEIIVSKKGDSDDYTVELDDEFYFERGGLIFDRYGNVVKW